MAKLKTKTLRDLLEMFEQIDQQLVIDLPRTTSLVDDQLAVSDEGDLIKAIIFGPKDSPDKS